MNHFPQQSTPTIDPNSNDYEVVQSESGAGNATMDPTANRHHLTANERTHTTTRQRPRTTQSALLALANQKHTTHVRSNNTNHAYNGGYFTNHPGGMNGESNNAHYNNGNNANFLYKNQGQATTFITGHVPNSSNHHHVHHHRNALQDFTTNANANINSFGNQDDSSSLDTRKKSLRAQFHMNLFHAIDAQQNNVNVPVHFVNSNSRYAPSSTNAKHNNAPINAAVNNNHHHSHPSANVDPYAFTNDLSHRPPRTTPDHGRDNHNSDRSIIKPSSRKSSDDPPNHHHHANNNMKASTSSSSSSLSIANAAMMNHPQYGNHPDASQQHIQASNALAMLHHQRSQRQAEMRNIQNNFIGAGVPVASHGGSNARSSTSNPQILNDGGNSNFGQSNTYSSGVDTSRIVPTTTCSSSAVTGVSFKRVGHKYKVDHTYYDFSQAFVDGDEIDRGDPLVGVPLRVLMQQYHAGGTDGMLAKQSQCAEQHQHVYAVKDNRIRDIENFPKRLFSMVSDTRTDDAIQWLPHGRAFVIKNTHVLEAKLELYFKPIKFKSFQRQLNLWNFKRLTAGLDSGAYYHMLFLRGKRRLVERMALSNKKPGGRPLSNPEEEPDFYFLNAVRPLPNSISEVRTAHLQNETKTRNHQEHGQQLQQHPQLSSSIHCQPQVQDQNSHLLQGPAYPPHR
mmetsp:Transcript_14567/g.22458  ORF Transcript_14567/g.22458 Transcript_14567/m.22458 type:complete len:677 (-) Transcript_14567:129-2159(-)